MENGRAGDTAVTKCPDQSLIGVIAVVIILRMATVLTAIHVCSVY